MTDKDRGPAFGGLGNHFESEALEGAVPRGQNSPQKVPYNLYPEQLSGSAFTQPRAENIRSWLYKTLPSVIHGNFEEYKQGQFLSAPLEHSDLSPNQMRWDPLANPQSDTDFVDGTVTMAGNGSPLEQVGVAVHHYAFNSTMKERYFVNSDGHMLFVPSEGTLSVFTEFGRLSAEPTEIIVIPKGIRFQIEADEICKGYICENYGAPYVIPDLGPIGSNGLANPRHFLPPVAEFEDKEGDFELIHKFNGKLWRASTTCSPLNTVGWQGNYWPYKYDLKLFNTINTVSFDHPDPSIFTVLTSPSGKPGLANIDFVIFPPRWMVAENTFRPPYYHRNIMSEYMGLIQGKYDAKDEGFVKGGASLHNCFTAHGPDAKTYEMGSAENLKPNRYENTLAFMFETRLPFGVSELAMKGKFRQPDYIDCWQGLKKHFKP